MFAFAGDEVRNVREVSLAIRLNVGETVDFTVTHSDGVVENIPVHARWTPPKGQGPTGGVVERSGWEPLLDFAALLSINLAILNVLPLPMLDGGRIAFVLLEIA